MEEKDQAIEEEKELEASETPDKEAEMEAEGPDIYGLLASIPGSPAKEQIATWKTSYDVEASVFSEEEVYIWRPITWHEYKMLQQSSAENPQNPNFFDEQVIYKCVLWPKVMPETLPVMKGGTIPTLSQQIMEGSNFIPPQVAMNLVYKL